MRVPVLAFVLLVLPVSAAAQAHDHGTVSRAWHAGAQAILLGTRVDPAVGGEPLTEGYVTQPTLYGGASLLRGHLELMTTISLEGLTLERGELGPGTYGEGYVDRRHPHTYLHELTASASHDFGPVAASLTAGRGFAPFGTDDPMSRPFVRFPANHHLGQILERLIAIGALRAGPVIVEAGVFNGDEPSEPWDFGSRDRFADSWSARVTALPLAGLELQVSHAFVVSPELPRGGGWDQRKWSASARVDRALPIGDVYALVEWEQTTQVDDGDDVFAFGSVLGEASVARGRWSVALRAERTDRPEEDRISAYRSPWPHPELHVLGITEWTIVSARGQRDLSLGPLRLAPF
ncbi:MAG TPA: hypothetical protein VF039_03970, partial [Longimicrobiales bacterium]